jgi:hypothetical protein
MLIRSVGKRTSADAMLICVLLGSAAFMSKSCSLPFVLVGTRKPEVATIPSNPTADSAKEIQLIGLETVSLKGGKSTVPTGYSALEAQVIKVHCSRFAL